MRSCLVVLAGLAACAILPTGRGGGSGRVEPAPGSVVSDHPWLAGLRVPVHLRRPPPHEEEAIAVAVEEYATGEFSVYPSAGRRLVEKGEIVVPYLGHAAEHIDIPEENRTRIGILLALVLEDVGADRVGYALHSPYPTVRIAGAVCVGDRHLTEHAPKLVDRLEDSNLQVRRASVTALRRVSNAFYGYRADDTARRRAKAVAKWRALWGAG